jgi:L-ascorbate metabolism protein UlaG (beta-lactamase superfamily)
VAHACFRLQAEDGTVLMIDPFASRVWLGYDFPVPMLATENVLISHPHYDHDYGEFIGNPVPWLSTQTVLRETGTTDIGPFRVTGVEGKHADPWGTEFGQKNTIWIIEVAGLRIAHLGDNGPLSTAAAAAIGQVDILMAPIDGNEHILKYAELRNISDSLRPAWVIPMHYRLPDLETNANSPDDLGEVDPWLQRQAQVERVGSSRFSLSIVTLPDEETALVFDHGL